MTILIVDNYDSFTFNLYQLIQEQTEQEVVVKRNDQISLAEIGSLAPSGIVLSPGPGHPGTESDFRVCKDVIENAASLKCPILGVCLGHQGLAHYLGGQVGRAPQIVHGKMSTITVSVAEPLFEGVSTSFQAMRYHSLVVEDKGLPSCLTVTARDADTQLIMAMQHETLPLYGVQFHPESIGTPQGRTIIKNFLKLCQ